MRNIDSDAQLRSPIVENPPDLLWRHLTSVPAFRALLRAIEARMIQGLDLPAPVLDLGCGDGHFAKMTFKEPLTIGADPWWGPLRKAKASQAYRMTVQSTGDTLPFPDNYFGTVVSNSVLEHIPNVTSVLQEINRVLRHDGGLVITMPSHLFTEWLGGSRFLRKLGLPGLARSYERFFNFVSRHEHVDAPETWADRLSEAGFAVERWQYYFSKRALRALEIGHVQGLPSAITHFLTGRWILAPWPSSLRRTEGWLRPYYDEKAADPGAYMLFVARKKAKQRTITSSVLPPPEPLELLDGHEDGGLVDQPSPADAEDFEPILKAEPAALESVRAPRPEAEQPPYPSSTREETKPSIRLPVVSTALLAMSLLFAGIAQSILSNSPADPVTGLRWYFYSLVAFLILAWRQRKSSRVGTLAQIDWRRWRPSTIPRRFWLLLPGLLFTLLAYRTAASPGGSGTPPTAILLWVIGIFSSAYAFHLPWQPSDRPRISVSRSTLAWSLAVVLVALTLRLVRLTEHPFILNGVEASIGNDALSIANGLIRNPFSTGWLTNPTLPSFLLAVPVGLLGPSVLSVRLLSPFVGAITVLVTFLFGSRLWGRPVGMIAAVFIAGSHWHIHYSRLAMTNIWDPLLMLLALCLIVVAWQHADNAVKRSLWLAAGAAAGLNAYLFTSSRLLPLILLGLASLALLFDRRRLLSQWKHVGAAFTLTVVIALPQLLYYSDNPTVYLDRANTLGILDSQSGWLASEAARTGQSQLEVLGHQFLQSALAFNSSIDRSTAYSPQVPLLGVGSAILFVYGLVAVLLHLRRPENITLVIWLACTIVFAGALLIESPSSHRLLAVSPAVYLFIAIGLAELAKKVVAVSAFSRDTSENASDFPYRTYLLAAMIAVAVVISFGDILFYFGRYQEQHLFGDRNTEIAYEMANYLKELDGNWTAYFYGPPSMYVGFPTIPFLATNFKAGINLYDVMTPDDQLAEATTPNEVHIFLPERAEELASLQANNNDGQLNVREGFHANPLFYAFELRN